MRALGILSAAVTLIAQSACVGPTELSPGLPFYVRSLSTSGDHTCALVADGSAYCWGANESGQLGDGTTEARGIPVRVLGGLTFESITTGAELTCAVTAAGAAYCWGSNRVGQLGDGTTVMRLRPTAVAGGLVIKNIAIGGFWETQGIPPSGRPYNPHTCAVTVEGAGYCWGSNGAGQLGDGSVIGRATPFPIQGGLTFQSLTIGTDHSCGLAIGGTAYCWGGNLGPIRAVIETSSPTAVAGGLPFQSLVSGYYHVCGITSVGGLYCWGFDDFAVGGSGLTYPGVRQFVSPLKFRSITTSSLNICALTTTSVAYCWGYNSYGQLGNGTQDHSPAVAVTVMGGLSFSALSSGFAHTCGVVESGKAYCWGNNSRGQIGDGSNSRSSMWPTAVRAP